MSLPHLKSQIRTGQRLESGEELLAGIVYGEAHLAAGEEFHISGLAAEDGGNMNQRDAGHGRFRGGQTARLGDKNIAGRHIIGHMGGAGQNTDTGGLAYFFCSLR